MPNTETIIAGALAIPLCILVTAGLYVWVCSQIGKFVGIVAQDYLAADEETRD